MKNTNNGFTMLEQSREAIGEQIEAKRMSNHRQSRGLEEGPSKRPMTATVSGSALAAGFETERVPAKTGG